MKKILYTVICGALLWSAHAEVTKLPAEVKAAILKSQGRDSVVLIKTVGEIPIAVLKACSKKNGGFELANPGEKFQVTDTVMEPGLAARRLIWCARISGYYILHHELGGIGHSYHILIVTDPALGQSAKLVWKAASMRFPSYDEFIEVLSGQALDDRLEYGY